MPSRCAMKWITATSDISAHDVSTPRLLVCVRSAIPDRGARARWPVIAASVRQENYPSWQR